MSLTIRTNLSSLIAQNSLKTSTNKLNQAIERMTSGAKINHAKDNAANYSIATNMTTKINAYMVAEDNCAMGLDLVSTASSSLELMSDLTSRLRALATQAQNGTYGSNSISAINSEAKAIIQEMNRIKNTTQFNGIQLLGDSAQTANASAISTYAVEGRAVASPQAGASGFIEEVTKRDTSSMTTLASVDESTALTSGTYSISTAEELAKLATMTNNGLIGENTEFVLANDIDLSAYSSGEGWTPIGYDYRSEFTATFDGNGYTISNLYINRTNDFYQGLFGAALEATIKNVGVVDVDVTGNDYVGGLVGIGRHAITITNCYATGSVTGTGSVGGLVGWGEDATTITNCYATGSVTGTSMVGGLVGEGHITTTITNCYAICSVTGTDMVGGLVGNGRSGTISNCYATGSVTGDLYVGGLVGNSDVGTISYCYATGEVIGKNQVGGLVGNGRSGTISNCYATGSVTGDLYVGGLTGVGTSATLENAYYIDTTGQSVGIGLGTPTSGTAQLVTMAELDELIAQGILPAYIGYSNSSSGSTSATGVNLTLQVGINSSDSSQIGVSIAPLDISALDGLDLTDSNSLSIIDEILNTINNQQTALGAVQNRLESALDSIAVSYDNLVSSRSTIQDADIAELSSEYIKMQILQQASATLMATANQSPSIALQLL